MPDSEPIEAAAVSARPAGPREAFERLSAIDACRGFALLGIFMVNIGFFSGPIGDLLKGIPPAPAEGFLESAVHYVTAVFFTGKFYPLFSLLFGAGLILQMSSVQRRGGKFVPIYLRRLFVLALLGLSHAMLVWYGDILFIYAFAGLALLLVHRLKPATLFILAGVLFAIITVVSVGGAAVGAMFGSAGPGTDSAATTAESPQPGTDDDGHEMVASGSDPVESATDGPGEPADDKQADVGATEPTGDEASSGSASNEPSQPRRPYERLLEGFASRSDSVQGPWDDRWKDAERDVYQHGGFVPALIVRAITWAAMIVFCLFGFGWHVLMMFLIGAALIKVDFFSPSREAWHRRLIVIGVVAGLPLSILAASAPALFDPGFARSFLQGWGVMAGGPLVSLMYVSVITLAFNRGYARAALVAVSNVGRLALSNYLMQSAIATFVFYWFGLGLFDQVSRAAGMFMVVGIYLVQVLFSNVWMSFFAYGPMEWIWRSLTYLRVPPLFRAPASEQVGRN